MTRVIVDEMWLRGVLKRAKQKWPKDAQIYDGAEPLVFEVGPECPKSGTGQHVSSKHSTFPFCTWCGKDLG